MCAEIHGDAHTIDCCGTRARKEANDGRDLAYVDEAVARLLCTETGNDLVDADGSALRLCL